MRKTLILAAGLAGCSGIGVERDYDRTYDFSRVKTWAWAPDGRSAAETDLVRERIEGAVERELAAKAYEKVGADEADVWIRTFAAAERQVKAEPFYGLGYYGQDLRVFDEGTLVVDVVSPRERRLLWRGTARGAIDRDATPEERDERVAEAVGKILEAFPPEK